jgi:hypothetical protein
MKRGFELTQDEHARALQQWRFTKYDILGRAVLSGRYTDPVCLTRKTDERHTSRKLLFDQADGLVGTIEVAFFGDRMQLGQLRRAAHGLGKNRPLPCRHLIRQAHRLGDHEDVRKDDGRIYAQDVHGLQRDGGGVCRLRDHGPEAAGLSAHGAVFAKEAASLAHEPHGRALHLLAPRRAGSDRFAIACRRVSRRRGEMQRVGRGISWDVKEA